MGLGQVEIIILVIGGILFIAGLIALIWILFQHSKSENSSQNSFEARKKRPIANQVLEKKQPVDRIDSAAYFGLQFIFDAGRSETFESLPISIGRSTENNLVLDDDTISGQHARVYYDQKTNSVCIADLDSLNGVYVDGQPTRRNILRDGMSIRLGDVQFTYRDTGYIHNETI